MDRRAADRTRGRARSGAGGGHVGHVARVVEGVVGGEATRVTDHWETSLITIVSRGRGRVRKNDLRSLGEISTRVYT